MRRDRGGGIEKEGQRRRDGEDREGKNEKKGRVYTIATPGTQ